MGLSCQNRSPQNQSPQNQSGQTNFGKKPGSPGPLLLPKLVPLVNFGPPGGLILARSYLPKLVPPVHYFLYYTIELSHYGSAKEAIAMVVSL